jgi:hypothetical protein
MGQSYGGMTKCSCLYTCPFQRFTQFSQICSYLIYKFVRYQLITIVFCLSDVYSVNANYRTAAIWLHYRKLDCRLNAAIWWCQSKITQFNNLITRHDFVNICKKQMEPFPFDRFYICRNLCHNNYTITFKISDTFIYFLLGYGCQKQSDEETDRQTDRRRSLWVFHLIDLVLQTHHAPVHR